ncbi:MAG: hypothetical protein K0R65_9 [Crocinitomicaceae bacterium]|jgi:hypothetical protein|nr:hypothetical protein [Crocinitomicaceae bacterium]
MNRIVPFKKNYDLVKTIDQIGLIILYTTACTTITLITLSCVDKIYFDPLIDGLNALVTFFSVVYFLSSIAQTLLFPNAEFKRRKDFIDNSFNTNFSDTNSVDYFTNEEINHGVYKMGVNCYENAFHSKAVVRGMLPKEITITFIIFICILILSITVDKNNFAMFLQIALPFTVILQTTKMLVLYFSVKGITDEFKSSFVRGQYPKMEADLVHLVLKYEKALSWAGLVFSEKVWTKLKDQLATDWANNKTTLNIQ